MPGNPDESLLITAIRYTDESLQMPPKSRLPHEVVADFEEWVKMGAPDPRGAIANNAATKATVDRVRESAASSGRSSRPGLVKPPAVKDAAWPKTDIDRFLLAAARGQGPEARRPTPTGTP